MVVAYSRSLTATKKVFLSVDGLFTERAKLSSHTISLTQAAHMTGCLSVSVASIPDTQIPTTLLDPISFEFSTGKIYPVLFEIKKPV